MKLEGTSHGSGKSTGSIHIEQVKAIIMQLMPEGGLCSWRDLTVLVEAPILRYKLPFAFQRDLAELIPAGTVEVKRDEQIEDAVVQAKKEFAQQMAVATGMEY